MNRHAVNRHAVNRDTESNGFSERWGLSPLAGIWTAWAVARLFSLYLFKRDRMPVGDVAYYFHAQFGNDPSAMTEYPHAGTWPVELLAWITGGESRDAFYVAFIVFCLLLDAAFLAFLLRRHHLAGRRASVAAWFWIFFGTAAGHIFILRLDLVPGLAVGIAAALLVSHPTWGAGLLAFATTIKLWPGVLAAGLVGRFNDSRSWARLLSFVGTGIALCAVTVATAGWERLTSPLSYQSERGLQVESIAATPFIHAALNDSAYEVFYAPSKSFEITGPGVDTAIAFSSQAMILLIGVVLAWAVWHFIRGGWDPHLTAVFFVAVILGLIVVNKVFSPQYIVWLGPVLAVALRSAPSKLGYATATLTVLAAALGTFIFPFHYWDLVHEQTPTGVNALVVRNVLILIMFVLSLVWLANDVRKEVRQRRGAAEAA